VVRGGGGARGALRGCVGWLGRAVICKVGASRFAAVNLTTARVSSIGRSRRAVVVVLHRGEVDFGIGAPVIAVIRWSRLPRGVFVGCVGWRSRSVGHARITRQRRQGGRIGWDRADMGAAVISELEARRLVYLNTRMDRISSMVVLRGDMKHVIGRGLQ